MAIASAVTAYSRMIINQHKLEHEIQEGIFVMPKVYYLLTSDNKEVLKCKGYPGKLTRSNYLALLKGETLQELQVNKWQRSLKDSNVQIKRAQPYYLRFLFNKRQQIFEKGVLGFDQVSNLL